VSRRRGSESKPSGGAVRDSVGTNGPGDQTSDIKEEVEENRTLAPSDRPRTPELRSLTHLDSRPDPPPDNSSQQSEVDHASIPDQIIDNVSPVLTNGSGTTMTLTEPSVKARSPDFAYNTTLAGLEWSYVDVQGQVQGRGFLISYTNRN
jgi:hypothetical protein